MSKVRTFIQAISRAYPQALVIHNEGGKEPKFFMFGQEHPLTENMIRDGRFLTEKDLVPANSKNKIPKQYVREPLEGNLACVGKLLAGHSDWAIVFVRYDGSNKVFKVAVADLRTAPAAEEIEQESPVTPSPWSR